MYTNISQLLYLLAVTRFMHGNCSTALKIDSWFWKLLSTNILCFFSYIKKYNAVFKSSHQQEKHGALITVRRSIMVVSVGS